MRAVVFAACVLPVAVSLPAQTPPHDETCAGRRVSAIAINPQRPQFEGSAGKWRRVARALGLHHTTTRAEIIRAYLLVREGDVCTDDRRLESARLLRGLPFLADASVRVRPDSAGTVTLEVETIDEIPVLVAGSVRHGRPAAIALGNENLGGLGLRLNAGLASNTPYRTSAFVEAADYAPFGQPAVFRVAAQRDPLGGHVELEASRPFLSNFQRGAWHASYRIGDDYPNIVRPVGDNQAVQVHEQRWSIGGVFKASFGRTVTLWGPVLLGNKIAPANQVTELTDSGARPGTDAALLARFTPFNAGRLGALLGARNVRFVTRTGFDALFAPQDVMVGWQVGTLTAPGMTSANGRDLLVAQSIYAGGAARNAFIVADLESEARRDFTRGRWQSTIANARAGAYYKPHPQLLIDVQDNYSSLGAARLPTQLSLGDNVGGPRGYIGSTLAGGRRNVVRGELRAAFAHAIRPADLGVALFADAASMWAGDVPYGVSASRQSFGWSFLAAYPKGSQRLYRIDFAFPVRRGGLQIRFTTGDPTSGISIEPGDVTQARLAPIPSSLFAWPGR